METLKQYGIFVVPVGELECWLPHLNIPTGNKTRRLREVFRVIGATQDDPNYLHPTDDGIWAFLRDVAMWIENETREVMPIRSDNI